MEVVEAALPVLLKGARVSLIVAVQAGLLALVVSVVVGALRDTRNRLVGVVTGAYVEFFRGTSAFVQIYWAYFVLPMLGVRIDALHAGVLVLGLNVGAYGAEVVRGALAAVPTGQREAAAALGLPTVVTYLKVLIPQAMTRTVLPFGNLMIDLLKGTSLLSAITVTDLTFAARQTVASIGHPFIVFGIVLCLYLVMTAPIAWAARVLDARQRRWLPRGKA